MLLALDRNLSSSGVRLAFFKEKNKSCLSVKFSFIP